MPDPTLLPRVMLEKTSLQELIGLLDERLRVIADADWRARDPDGQLARLAAVSESISAFHRAHRAVIPPRLNHFLGNWSLEKARDWAAAELEKA